MPTALPTFASNVLDPRRVPPRRVSSLYVHVPFCFHKCHYCDFYSITRQTPVRMNRFVDLVLAELDLWTRAKTVDLAPRTIFFGGGTPSLLPVDAMERLLAGLQDRLDFSGLEEFTVEVNPATADRAFLDLLRSRGVDRISLGAQSFDRSELATLERHHDPHDVERSIALCRDAGFDGLNIDLIYAIPGQTIDSFRRSLDRAIALKLEHYACYNLTYEPNTPMAVRQRLGQFEVIEESIELQMLQLARATLADAGHAAYEISNYGRPCEHNLVYWRGGDYLGLGPSAASHVSGLRFKNRPHLGEWERSISAGELPAIDVETLSVRQQQGEAMMLGLRLAEGVRTAAFVERFGERPDDAFGETLGRLASLGLIERSPEAVRLAPAALAVADAVAAEFLTD